MLENEIKIEGKFDLNMKIIDKAIIGIIILLSLDVAAIIALMQLLQFTFFATENYGREFGYYGQFNRILHVIEDLPDVEVVEYWYNEDLTLEDFQYTIRVENKYRITIYFPDGSPEKYETDREKIREYVYQKINARLKSRQE